MESYFLEGHSDTPEVKMNFEKGIFEFSGKSLPEDVDEFYSPLQQKIEQYLASKPSQAELIFRFEYFNTSSSKKLMDILTQFGNTLSIKNKLNIKWYYKLVDEDMLEAGQDLAEITELSFSFIEM